VGVVTCQTQRDLVLQTLDAVKVEAPSIRVDSEAYVSRVRARALELVSIVGAAGRLFEVGLRAASCLEQHLLALEGCRQAGLTRTSHVYGARRLGLVPVGTMGHEHVQRFGSDDAAFRAMVERRYARSSFLLDTFDTMTSGLPAAFELMRERGQVGDSIRYDSGDKEAQYRRAFELSRQFGVRPVQILEDGFDAAQTRRFEALRVELGLAPSEQVYGYGGYLVAQTAGTPLTRDRVSAVYKLSQTGRRPTMKFGNDGEGGATLSGKQSVPGVPVVFRRRGGSGPFGLIGQHGEAPPEGYALLTGVPAADGVRLPEVVEAERRPQLSSATQGLMRELRDWRKT
jgi:nicotinate phosphoribosyltransferase